MPLGSLLAPFWRFVGHSFDVLWQKDPLVALAAPFWVALSFLCNFGTIWERFSAFVCTILGQIAVFRRIGWVFGSFRRSLIVSSGI